MLYDDSENKAVTVYFGNQELVFCGLGALLWPAQNLLVVADLHLEKGSYYADRGNPLPLYDTYDTLIRLQELVSLYQPKRMISLGDNIHDIQALVRMSSDSYDLLNDLSTSVNEWLWLAGNHDKNTLPERLANVSFYSTFQIENITFSHDFQPQIPLQIVGHYHPKATVKNIKGKCFLANDHKIIMPSFGSYTGGLDIDSISFKKIIQKEVFKAYLLNRNKVWRVR